ncbi:COG3083 Predicted hydrolase of alkaline phosphatase superfamily [Flavobacteriaceae bacterium]
MATKLFLKQLYIVSIFNIIILLIISKTYSYYLLDFNDLFSKFYYIITTLSHFILVGILPLLIGISVFYISKSQLISKIFFSIFTVIFLLFLELDAHIYSQFRYHLNPIVFNLIFGKRASDTFQFSNSSIGLAILYIIVIIAIQFLFYYISKKIILKRNNLQIKTTSLAFLFLLLLSNIIYAWSDVNFYRPITQYKNVYPVFFPLRAENLLIKLNLVDSLQIKKNNAINFGSNQNLINYPLQKIISEPKTHKKNILFLVIDSWRADFMNKEITPNIYNLSLKCQVFQNHKSGSNMTTGGIFTLFYGIPATYFSTFTSVQKPPVFIDELQSQKYDLDIFASSTLENPPFNRNVFANVSNLRLFSKGDTPSERDNTITKEWMSKINQESSNPFFGYLFFDSAHGFDYPKNYKTVFNPSLEQVDYFNFDDNYDPTKLINRYKNSLYYIDSKIGLVIKQLEAKNLLKNTIIVITSDHGQEFNDNKKGYWQHGGNFSKYQINVPMMIFDFNKTPKKYNHLTLHYDIIPTIMKSVLGVKNPISDYCVGQDLFDVTNRDWFVCGYNQKYSVIEKKQITNIYESGLYDVLDLKLNNLNQDMNYEIVSKAFVVTNKFYQKESDKKQL